MNLTNSLSKLYLLNSVVHLSNIILEDKKNQMALITFAGEGQIVTDFTNDQEMFSSFTNHMVTDGKASYYQGLLKVEEILKEYEEKEDRDCIAVF